MMILGIETSCDETAMAVVEGEDRIRSNVIHSQVKVHEPYGGVVPELASRHHLQRIHSILEQALGEAEVTLDDIDGVAVTSGPGLMGCLLVGLSFGKSLAWGRHLPMVGINHLEGHIQAAFLEHPVELPALFLVVSGGHTALYHVTGRRTFRRLAHTRDDAAGEAYDKVAKLLGLGYPGGPIIDSLVRQRGYAKGVPFKVPRMSDGSLDFSFSGIKTAVLYHVRDHGIAPLTERPSSLEEVPGEIMDLLAGFQEAVVKTLVTRTLKALDQVDARCIGVVGGVACNQRLRERMTEECSKRGLPVYIPSPPLCADNGVMIAAAGRLRLEAGERDSLSLNADPGWQIGID